MKVCDERRECFKEVKIVEVEESKNPQERESMNKAESGGRVGKVRKPANCTCACHKQNPNEYQSGCDTCEAVHENNYQIGRNSRRLK